MVRRRTRTRPPVGDFEISIFVVPVDLGRELPALFGGGQDVHDESAMIERSSDRAVKPANVLDLRAHPLANRPSYRRNQRHGMRRYVDDATGKLATYGDHGKSITTQGRFDLSSRSKGGDHGAGAMISAGG